MLTILFDGVAYGMLLFVLAVGLCVTLGLMNFINLAHGAFAMAGGYATALLVNSFGVSFYLCLPIAFLVCAALGALLERTLYARLYERGHLDQVLFSIGLIFMAMAAIDYFFGARPQNVQLPAGLDGRINVLGASIGIYRLFVIVVCGLLTVGLQYVLTHTRFGSRLRAAVDDGRVARGLGVDVAGIFAITFAAGSGLAGFGGALGAGILSLDPSFPLKYMILFLIVVSVGGAATITGPFFASILLGVADVMGKYYEGAEIPVPGLHLEVPRGMGAFTIYIVMVVVLILRPQGLFVRSGAR